MRVIKDLNGQEWKLQITVGSIIAVRGELKMDLYNIGDDGFIRAVIDDPFMIFDILWVLLEDQIKERDIDKKAFGKAFSGDCIATATVLFLEELTEFFPPGKRETAANLLKKTRQLAEMAYKKIDADIENLDLEKEVDTAMETMKQNLKT